MNADKLLQPVRVLANVEARSKKHALEILSELIAGSSEELSHVDIFEALLERERIGNTGLGKGVAIPHGQLENIADSIGAFLKLSEPIDYGAQDGQAVSFIFAVAVPGELEANQFEDVAGIAKALSDEKLISSLTEASSSRAIYDLLAGYAAPEPESEPDLGEDSDAESDTGTETESDADSGSAQAPAPGSG